MNLTSFKRHVEDAIYNARAAGDASPAAVILVRSPHGTSNIYYIQPTHRGDYVLTVDKGYFVAQGSLDDLYPYCNSAGIVTIR